jgi:crossover junction endodeoxyribonuclease RuvC
MTLIIGFDPGASGGLAWQLLGQDRTLADAAPLPATESDCRILVANLMALADQHRAFVEKVGATPQMGAVSSFSFGRSYGFLRGLLIGMAVPFEEVSPQRWQADFGLRQHGKRLGKGDTEKHNAIKGKAQQFFPHLKITHAKAAALMICEYGARRFRMEAVA